MKKKIISLLLVTAMFASMLTGCEQKKQDEGSQVVENVIEYDYYQDLNIIDDNYRNYYEIFVYSFYDSDGDCIGDLQGVIEKLDYVEYMGFNGIWLMPIMPSPTYHKYDATDYCAIDETYGTMEDFEELVKECHDRGINVVIDLAINHSSSEHPWFTQACEYLRGLEEGQEPDLAECPYVDYYHFSKEKEASTYYAVSGTDWYYEGAFWSGMPDLNLQSEAVRKEIQEIAKFWIDKGVDGFRMDAVRYYDRAGVEANNEVLNWLYTECTKLNPDFYMVSEAFEPLGTIAQYYGSKTPSMFNFDAGQQTGMLFKAAKGYMAPGEYIDQLLSYDKRFSEQNPDYIDAPFLTNHDMGRVAEVCVNNETNMKMAAGLMMMMNGSPFVYYGEEIGMNSMSDKDENKRLPMYWSDIVRAGTTDGPPNCNLSITSSFEAVDEQLKDGHSLLNYYRHAIRLRNENPEIARGEIKKIDALCTDSYGVMTKTYEGSTIAIAINNKDAEVQITLTDSEIAEMKIRGYLTIQGEEITLKDGVLTLPAKSICILK
ncbi:MAG: alpha amylase [Agathobacter sp.]|nr:alpha amylase [Agathobacter sp.]